MTSAELTLGVDR